MGAYKYTPTQKVAILMLALGDELASELMTHMPKRDVLRIGRALSSMQRIDQGTVDEILIEFRQKFQEPAVLVGGPSATRRLLARALSDEEALALDSSGPGLTALDEMQPPMIADFLSKEEPQTAALVMAHLPPQKFKDTLKRMPETLHAELLMRVARLEAVDHGALEDLNQALEEELAKRGHAHGYRVGGPEKVAKLLNALESDLGRQLLDHLADRDPDLTAQIRDHLFTFEDLVKVNDQGMQLLLQKIDRKDLLLSLKLAPEAWKDKIFANLSERARQMLAEDLESLPKTPRSDVEAAQKRIAALALHLRDAGQLNLIGDDEYV